MFAALPTHPFRPSLLDGVVSTVDNSRPGYGSQHLGRVVEARHKEISVARTPSLLLLLIAFLPAVVSSGCCSNNTDRAL